MRYLPSRSTLARYSTRMRCHDSRRPSTSSRNLGILPLAGVLERQSASIDQKLECHECHTRTRFPSTSTTGSSRRRAVPERPARAPQRRPDPVAVQGPSAGLDRPAPGRRRPPARLPLAGPGARRTSTSSPTTTASSASPPSAARRPPPSGCASSSRAAYGTEWSTSLLDELLTEAGCKPGTTLDDWLRNGFFEQHCKLFHHRPFIWHVWDGRKDGFAVPGQLPQARPQDAGEPDLLVPRRLDHGPGR